MALKQEQNDTGRSDIAALARLIGIHAPYDGTFELRVPGVYAIRFSQTNTELTRAVQRSSVCIIAQGTKSVMVGEDVIEYEPSHLTRNRRPVPPVATVAAATAH
jgi:AraC-type transcriptional regulator N-terminus